MLEGLEGGRIGFELLGHGGSSWYGMDEYQRLSLSVSLA